MCKVISISNQKGGVGKTTTTICLGKSLTEQGKRVLIIDFDPQANCTMSLGYQQPDELEVTIADLLQSEISNRISKHSSAVFLPEDYILHSNGIDFIPANIELAGLENTLINIMSRENVLKNFLERHKSSYDYILIDTLPSLNILTVNALNASNEIVIPVQAQFLSVKGLELLLQTIANVKENLNPNLEIAGILITMWDKRANFQKDVIQIVIEMYGKYIRIFDSKIPTSVKVSETQSIGKTIFSAKNNKVAEQYNNFAKELLENE